MTVLVLLADDHAMVRDGLKPFLAPLAPDLKILEAGDFPAVQDAVSRSKPDLAIIDLKMPGLGSIDDIGALKRHAPNMKLVVLSGSVDRADVVRAYELGLAGYLPKSLAGAAITHALQLVMSGEKHFPSAILMQAAEAPGSSLPSGSPFRVLSPRELDIVLHLVGGAPNKEIANRLGLTEITVKAHLRSVFRKMGVNNRTQLVVLAIEHGLKA
ncbi:response regulator protein VraR [mine drainage metagenome]|uniref:Response regulator protein VraR n=1 Tax=mine drainage metagenome TaxID=410659 RepID=A0A1J5QWI0_9ZZZZ